MKKPKLSSVKKIIKFISKYKLLVALSLIISSFSVALALYIPILAGGAIDLIKFKSSVDFAGLGQKILLILACTAVAAVLQWVLSVINNKITYETVKDIRDSAFKKIQRLPLSHLDRVSSGDTVSRVISDADQFAEGLLLGFSQLFTGAVTIIGTIVLMFTINTWVTLIVILLTPISIFVSKFIAKKTHKLFKGRAQSLANLTSLTEEAVTNRNVIKAFSYEDEMLEKFTEANENLSKVSLKAIFFSSTTNPSTRFINGLVYAGIGVFGALAALSGNISIGGLTCFLSYADQYTKPFNEISGVITELQNAVACFERITEFLQLSEQEPDDALPELNDAEGYVLIDNVSFSYSPEKPLIKGLNLSVKPGKRVAIVGPTGCGKTTLINLLMRFYDVTAGTISVDGTDIRTVKRNSLRRNFGMVLQETWIKNATVAENIALGKPDATAEEIITAAKDAHAHSFICQLPNGYDTVLDESGSGLSVGQKQLLCIARIMFSRPDILILDEATSSIDTRTELKIQSAFNKIMQGRTSFIVAHRLSTIQNADVILVMNNGSVLEQGTHSELLSRRGFYYNLYNSQFE